jgi:excisionase family DNA binding protein
VEAAVVLRKHPLTVRRMLHAGKLPGVRIGGRYFIHRDDLARLVAPRILGPEISIQDVSTKS